MLVGVGQQAIMTLCSHLFFITVTWWALQGFQLEKLIKKNKVIQARLLMVLLTIAVGSAVSNFFLDYLFWSQRIPALFY